MMKSNVQPPNPDWHRSRYSSGSNCIEVGSCEQDFRKSSYSMANGNCIEVAPCVQVRDSKDPELVLMFSADAWTSFVQSRGHDWATMTVPADREVTWSTRAALSTSTYADSTCQGDLVMGYGGEL
jgi:hypothetical protein